MTFSHPAPQVAPRTTHPAMSNCDRATVETYLKIMDQPREGAALYCPICSHRITFTDGEWRTGT